MPTTLPITGLVKPTVGGDSDAWGTSLNGNADIIEGWFDAGIVLKNARLAITTATQFLANTTGKLLTTHRAWAAAELVTLTDASTIAVNMSTLINGTMTLAGNRTLGNPTSAKAGQSGVIFIVQDGTGSRTLAYESNWKFGGGADPVLSTAPNTVDMLSYIVRSSTFVAATLIKGLA